MTQSWVFEAPLAHASATTFWDPLGPEREAGATFRKFTQPFRTPWMNRAEELLIQHIRKRRVDSNTAGRVFQRLTAKDLRAQGAQEKFPRRGRRPDVGNRHEVTLQGHGLLDEKKIAQLRKDLTDVGEVLLTVPFLSQKAEQQLKQLGKEVLTQSGGRSSIIVRQTHNAPVLSQQRQPTKW